MTYIGNLLATAFSANVGESGTKHRAFIDRIANNSDARQRDGLRAELKAALADPKYDWDALLDEHEVYPNASQTARQFGVDRIWTPLFVRESQSARAE